MTVKEFYDSIGGNYKEALSRLMRDDLIKRFVEKFLKDPSYNALVTAMKEKNYDEAFQAAHTLKGVSKNLALTEIGDASSNITEMLRGGQYEQAEQYLPKVMDTYEKVVTGIEQL